MFDDAGMLPDMLETRLRERYPQAEFTGTLARRLVRDGLGGAGQTEAEPEFNGR